ncbi:YggT family protein [Lacticaseibacillus daqingensis]|uniref:YggT family protein n=1 Tax=Lacticaseibacillus daqingensis TaxID=2486014 RepID=UPI000F78F043|nr:YggT family protein [Lacticaseibacillus daqingensis]
MITFLSLLYDIVNWGLYLYMVAIAVYILMTWFPGALDSKLGRLLGRIVEPFLGLFRFIPPIMGLDFSPIIAFFVLSVISEGVKQLLWWLIAAAMNRG